AASRRSGRRVVLHVATSLPDRIARPATRVRHARHSASPVPLVANGRDSAPNLLLVASHRSAASHVLRGAISPHAPIVATGGIVRHLQAPPRRAGILPQPRGADRRGE